MLRPQPFVCAPVCQLERLTGYLVKERQRRDEERAEQQARVEQLERTVAALVARLDDGRSNHHREVPEEPTSQPLPWQPQPRSCQLPQATCPQRQQPSQHCRQPPRQHHRECHQLP